MYSNDEHLLVIGKIEMPILPRSGSRHVVRQRKSLQFLCAWLLETVDLATLRIDAGHDMADGAILSSAVHRLKYHQ